TEIKFSELILRDYAGNHSIRTILWHPNNEDQIEKLFNFAKTNHFTIRPRGMGHSMAGQSLAQSGELQLDTSGLKEVRWINRKSGLLYAQAGWPIYQLTQWLNANGPEWKIAVTPDADGPSLGGFF